MLSARTRILRHAPLHTSDHRQRLPASTWAPTLVCDIHSRRRAGRRPNHITKMCHVRVEVHPTRSRQGHLSSSATDPRSATGTRGASVAAGHISGTTERGTSQQPTSAATVEMPTTPPTKGCRVFKQAIKLQRPREVTCNLLPARRANHGGKSNGW